MTALRVPKMIRGAGSPSMMPMSTAFKPIHFYSDKMPLSIFSFVNPVLSIV
jgi:hypothetical protein